MADTGSIMGLVAAFIGVAIMLGVGTQILGNTVMDCTTLPDYNATTPTANGTNAQGQRITLDNQQTGWAGACVDNNTSTQTAYALLIIILIVIAAVAILFVVRML